MRYVRRILGSSLRRRTWEGSWNGGCRELAQERRRLREELTCPSRFTLCSSPNIEAAEMVEKLSDSSEASVVKLASFSLRTLVKERTFLDEFLARGGLRALQAVIGRSSGNTLGYSLLSMQSVMDLEETGWEGLEAGFVGRVVEIIGE